MDHYLLQLSYSASGWRAIASAGASFDDRLGPVRKLVAHLGGSFASFSFFDTPAFADEKRRHKVLDKFAMFGSHDLLAILAMPGKLAAQALSISLLSQPGINKVTLTALVPFEDIVTIAAAASRSAIATTGYAGPGRASD